MILGYLYSKKMNKTKLSVSLYLYHISLVKFPRTIVYILICISITILTLCALFSNGELLTNNIVGHIDVDGFYTIDLLMARQYKSVTIHDLTGTT